MSSCDQCLVRNRAICSALDAQEIIALNAIGRNRVLSPGESLIWEGEDSVLVGGFDGSQIDGRPLSHGLSPHS